MKTKYINLNVLAQNLGLPANYLRRLALNREIPCLNVNGKLRFDADAVEETLEKLSIVSRQNSVENQLMPNRVAVS